jgi:uracil-xanthine permease
MTTITTHPVDELPPWRNLLLFGLQHVLVMAAAPISAVFLMSKALELGPDLTVQLLAVTFLLSGIGSLLQSLGPLGVGVKLPFVMLPGGAPVVMFIAIAQEHGIQTASGAVLLTALLYFVALPVFKKLLRFFPPVVIGTMVVIIGANLIRINAVLVTGQPGTPGFGNPTNLALGLGTVLITVLLFRVLRGMTRQLAVMLGLLAGAFVAAVLGLTSFSFGDGTVFALPTPMPYGMPTLDVIASIPLLIYSLASMAEATGQTVLNGEIVGKEIVPERDVPRTIKADAVVSLLNGIFGTSLMVTSGENIGIVRMSGVRSRFVTAMAGLILIVIGLALPVAALINSIPAAVVGGTGMVVFAIIMVLGIQMLRRVDLTDHANSIICATALLFGLLPIVVPGLYNQLPPNVRSLLGSGVAMAALVAVLMNILFNHLGRPGRDKDLYIPTPKLPNPPVLPESATTGDPAVR